MRVASKREVSRAGYLDVLCDTAPEHVGSGIVQQRPFQQTGVFTWMRLSDGCYLTRYLSSYRSDGPLRGIRGLSLAELARLAHRALCWVWLALAGMDEVLLFLLVDLQVGVSLGAELGSFDVVLESPLDICMDKLRIGRREVPVEIVRVGQFVLGSALCAAGRLANPRPIPVRRINVYQGSCALRCFVLSRYCQQWLALECRFMFQVKLIPIHLSRPCHWFDRLLLVFLE